MRKIILNLAISLDGYIADKEGGFAWIKGQGDNSLDTEEKFDFPLFIESLDTIVMGSKAYLDCPKETLESFKDHHLIVATSRDLDGGDNVELVNGDVVKRVMDLKAEAGKDIWLFGGGGLVDAFIKAEIIDEYIIGIIPIVLGEGIPLFRDNNPTNELHLEEFYVEDGIALMKYRKRI